MRNLLALLAAVVLIVAGLGWYLGWYHVQTTPTADGHREIKVDVDTKKITADVKKGVQEGTQKVEEFVNKNGGGAPPTGAPPRVVTPSPVSPPTMPVQSRFRVTENGDVEYTGVISVPVPIGQQPK